MPKKRITIELPSRLIELIDAEAKSRGLSRTTIFNIILSELLGEK